MSDNLYSRDAFGGQDIDLFRLSGPRSDQNSNEPQRRRVDFNVSQRAAQSTASHVNAINRSIDVGFAKDISERDLKVAVVVLDSVHAITQYLLTHPLVVIRRQTQVSLGSKVYHLTPFTVIALVVGIQSKQGFGVLWKGIASVFLTKAIQIGLESIISEMTPFVRDFSSKKMSVESVTQHLLLKGVAIVLVTPFLCSSCAETVQSSIASENPGIFDSIWEGFRRLTHWKISDRKLPIWLLCGPTLSYHLSYYLISSCVQKASLYVKNSDKTTRTENNNKLFDKYKEIMSSFWGQLVADVMLFPLQTVLMRLYLQGTRTIIDNVSKPSAVTPIISNYESTTDCFATIVKDEGRLGLMKGFGALVLQYSIHYSLLRLTKYCLNKTISGLQND